MCVIKNVPLNQLSLELSQFSHHLHSVWNWGTGYVYFRATHTHAEQYLSSFQINLKSSSSSFYPLFKVWYIVVLLAASLKWVTVKWGGGDGQWWIARMYKLNGDLQSSRLSPPMMGKLNKFGALQFFFFPLFWHGEVYMKLWTMTHGWACSKRIPAEQLSQAPSFNRACGWGLNLATYELQPSKPMLESQRPALSQPNLPSVKNCRDPLHGIWFNGVSTRVYRQNLFIWSQNKKHFVQSVFVE